MTEEILKAFVLAERERCARLAERSALKWFDVLGREDPRIPRLIGGDIRKPTEQEKYGG